MFGRKEFIVIQIGSKEIKTLNGITERGKFFISEYKVHPVSISESDVDVVFKNFLEDCQKRDILPKNIYICLADDLVFIRRIELPEMPENEILESIKWHLKEEMPEFEDSVFDYEILGRVQKEDRISNLDVLVGIVDKRIVQGICRLVRGFRLNLVKISMIPSSIHIYAKYAGLKGNFIIINISNKYSFLEVIREGKMVFTRYISLGIEHLQQSMLGVFVTNVGRVELTQEDVKKVIQEVGIPSDTRDSVYKGISGMQLLALMRPVLESIVADFKRSFTYYVTNYNEEALPTRVYLCGEGARVKGMEEYLKMGLGLKVYKFPLKTDFITSIDRRFEGYMLDFIPMLGVVVSGKKEGFSLFPEEYQIERRMFYEKLVFRVGLLLACAGISVTYVGYRLVIRDYQHRIQLARSQLSNLQNVKELWERVYARESFIRKIKSGQVVPVWILKELSRIVPGNIALHSIRINPYANSVRLSGYTIYKGEVSRDVITNFMEYIEESPFFEEAQLSDMHEGFKGTTKVLMFELKIGLRKL